MKGLFEFQHFDWDSFTIGKVYRVVGVAPWADYNTGERRGTKVTVVIVEDKTPYHCKAEAKYTNQYERLAFKVTGDVDNVAVGDCVVPMDVTAKVYEQYNNQLAVTCSGLSVVDEDA